MTPPELADTTVALEWLQAAVTGRPKTPQPKTPQPKTIVVWFDEVDEVSALAAQAQYDRAIRYDRAAAYFTAQGVTDPAAIRDLLSPAPPALRGTR